MKTRPLAGSVALAVTVALAATACGGPAGPEAAGGPRKVTVWIMKDSVTDAFLARFRTGFEAEHEDIDLDIQIQEWDGIGEKVTAALASKDAPDVIEVGNTQVAQYAASGGVRDLSDRTAELNGADWLPGLAEPGRVDGRQYGIPWYAANRVVIYHKDLFARAGVTAPPKTQAEWLAVTAKLNKGRTQGIYLPGQNWYTLSGFVWDEGGDLAVKDGTAWKGALDTPQALAGMDFYRRLQALGKGPKDSDEAKPPQAEVFAKGEVAQIIAVPGGAKIVEEINPALKGKLGFFPVPGKTAGKPGAVFTGGSDLIVPEASTHPEAAYEVVKALAGEKWQTDMARTMSYVPNRTSLARVIQDDAGTAAMAAGAAQGRATPNSPQWAAVEATNPIKQYMTAVLTGTDPARAAATASQSITRTLGS
ncbi:MULTISPECIES: extracellular solute-binding protein [Streptomyces]|uniref:Sugar transporter sugar binding protein n=1 Tax=Streptomyces venezuelae (strain ATCC 10712 / CBS 650.69 / DSM 40230 / JCM 4526 / NBRC 13096 / PD 04745) TaxID=953739 RepID=F2R1Y4_STRVP|nr:extracellular solute-binding protein [Streptomyces venezuelae]QES03282.1 extracellular solute-binding protein [Streptomyces venezuelae ATCC 10712]QES10320.1 extracellular solute-binding protein [Streptomyces venezuelae]CCA60651.1 sugar transporter sugar binding protein [Streptomyces venezuelae ATCC 10712]